MLHSKNQRQAIVRRMRELGHVRDTQDPARRILHTAFDVAYLALLEQSVVSLDDLVQQEWRRDIVDSVALKLERECAEQGRVSGAERTAYYCERGYREIVKLLETRTHASCAPAEEGDERTLPGLQRLADCYLAPERLYPM